MNLQATVLVLLGVTVMAPTLAVEPASNARLDEVARLGRRVMPFDLEKTLHVFSKTKQGGIQQVIAKDPANQEQIELIRAHLGKIAAEFKQGTFSDPTKIHGKNMPGLSALKNAEPGAIDIRYRELENGAEITYVTENPELIEAIHRWFEAQLSDHARHATEHHPNHMQHHQ